MIGSNSFLLGELPWFMLLYAIIYFGQRWALPKGSRHTVNKMGVLGIACAIQGLANVIASAIVWLYHVVSWAKAFIWA